jgi:uncharacterized surface protein with fasciclin (FAS1) repeats
MISMRTALAIAAIAAVGVGGVASPASASTSANASQQADIVDTAVAAGGFTTLTKLLKRAKLVGALRKPGPYTVFAPTDAAFEKVPERRLKALLRNRAKLRSVLLYHVAAGALPASEVVERSRIKTLNGKRVGIRVDDSDVFVNRAQVTTPDVMASNGVIHVIDRVLLPR